MTDVNFKIFEDNAALISAATDHISAILAEALDQRGRASAMLSGGSSPRPIYERLAQQPLAWNGVGLSLVDERWVPSGSAGSNADFLKDCFMDTPAERAHFLPLYNGHETARLGLEAASQALGLLAQPFDLCVLGMGLDGHTASWFPRSKGLAAALDPKNENQLAAIDATGCEVAGAHTDRITLTYSAIAAARQSVLLLPSAEKLSVFKAAQNKDVLDAPVKVLQALGEQLTIFALDETQ